MLLGKVVDINKQECLLSEVKKTSNILERMRGLLFCSKLKPMRALWIEPCPSVHTFGMTYPIDVVFLSENGEVLKVVTDLSPMRMAMCKNAIVSLELLSGYAEKSHIQVGMHLNWKEEHK